MFEQSLFERAAPRERRRLWAAAASSLFQFLLIGILVLIPLEYTKALPKQLHTVVALPPPSQGRQSPQPVQPRLSDRTESNLLAPRNIPQVVSEQEAEPLPPSPSAPGQGWGVPSGVSDEATAGVLGLILGATTAAQPPPAPKVEIPRRIRVGTLQQARWIFHPNPVYPLLAKSARIQGTVRLEAIISKQGTMESLKVVSGHPLLVEAAMDAVRQWRYQPTILNGEPVEVATTIDVNFTLNK